MNQLEYYSFMGYPADVLKDRYVPYAERFATGERVVDLGCGRGEFIEVLAEHGIHGVGVDMDPDMVEAARAKGLEVYCGNAADFLQAHAGEFDGVFAAHLAEHLPPEALVELLRRGAHALKGDGRLIAVTPNPRNLLMQLNDFWIDLQHVRYYSPDIMRWILHLAGLENVEVGFNDRYRLGPDWLVDAPAQLPQAAPSAEPSTREKLQEASLPPHIRERVAHLEEMVNRLSGWAHSLYPPGEYFATGTKPPA